MYNNHDENLIYNIDKFWWVLKIRLVIKKTGDWLRLVHMRVNAEKVKNNSNARIVKKYYRMINLRYHDVNCEKAK